MTDYVVDSPREGYYRTRMVRGGPFVPVHIWYGPPHDPETGEIMDRSPRWNALRNGDPCDAAEVWNWCCAHPINETEYHYLLRLKEWAVQHAPNEPEANPVQTIDPRRAAPVGPPRR